MLIDVLRFRFRHRAEAGRRAGATIRRGPVAPNRHAQNRDSTGRDDRRRGAERARCGAALRRRGARLRRADAPARGAGRRRARALPDRLGGQRGRRTGRRGRRAPTRPPGARRPARRRAGSASPAWSAPSCPTARWPSGLTSRGGASARALLAQRPRLLLAPGPLRSVSSDHRAAFAAVRRACSAACAPATSSRRLPRRSRCCSTRSTGPALPDLLVDVTAELPRLEAALAAYAEPGRPAPLPRARRSACAASAP